MTWSLDARIPLVFGDAATLAADDAVLLVGDGAPTLGGPVARCDVPDADTAHPAGCACCAPRGAIADALGRLFLQRARGEVSFFRRVVCISADPAIQASVRDALRDDPLASARFRRG